MKSAEERRVKRRQEAHRRLQQPLTASGIVYLFADQFAVPPASVPVALARKVIRGLVGLGLALQDPRLAEPGLVRVPYSGQQVEPRDLGPKLLEAAFVSLAQEGYVSLGVDKTTNLHPREVVAIILEKSGDDLPPSLERSIMDALGRTPQRPRLMTLVAPLAHGYRRMLGHKDFYWDGVADVVADALMEMGWLQRGVPTEETAPLLAAMAGQAETVKYRLENFAALDPHLHARLVSELMQVA